MRKYHRQIPAAVVNFAPQCQAQIPPSGKLWIEIIKSFRPKTGKLWNETLVNYRRNIQKST